MWGEICLHLGSIEEAEKRMIAQEENSARANQAASEEKTLLERSGTPTLRDLRAAAKNLIATIILEADSPMTEITQFNCRRGTADTDR
jgi:hypothetical protein